MIGSLDNPPIIIRKSRLKAALLLALSLAFVGLFIAMMRDDAEHGVWPYLGILLFGLAVPASLWELIRPGSLTISPTGIIRQDLWWKPQHFAWDEVSEFQVIRIRSTKMAGFTLRRAGQGQTGIRDFNRRVFGSEMAIDGMWQVTVEDLVALLNTARARWSRPRVAGAPASP